MPMSRSCSSWVPLRESLVGHDTCQPSLMGSMSRAGSDRELVVSSMDLSMFGKLHISRSCLSYSWFAWKESCFTTQFFLREPHNAIFVQWIQTRILSYQTVLHLTRTHVG